MYLRYFAWQFIGRENWDRRSWEVTSLAEKQTDSEQNFIDSNGNGQYDGEKLIKKLEGIDWLRYTLPLPLMFGLIGIYLHFKRDWIGALSVLSLFLTTRFLFFKISSFLEIYPFEYISSNTQFLLVTAFS